MKKKEILILGAGYAGMITAIQLQKTLDEEEANITLVNKNDYHYQTTWLHEGASGTIDPERIRIPIQDVISQKRVNFIKDTVIEIQEQEKKVILKQRELSYDYLVIALGFETETFGIKGLKEHALTLVDFHSASFIRAHIEYCFAKYNYEIDKREELLTIVVGGAGFTGIEFLGELANQLPFLCKKFAIDQKKVRLICVERAAMPLPGFNDSLVHYAVTNLQERGIEFKTNTAIMECREDGIVIKKDHQIEEIKAATVVWVGGVRGNSIVEKSGFQTIKGRIKVEADLRVPGMENVFVIGDCALFYPKENNNPLPPTAQVAVQMAKTCATNLASLIKEKKELSSFVPTIRGTVCSLGHRNAIGIVFGKRKIYGWKAVILKKIIDNIYLWKLGGLSLLLRKGKFL